MGSVDDGAGEGGDASRACFVIDIQGGWLAGGRGGRGAGGRVDSAVGSLICSD